MGQASLGQQRIWAWLIDLLIIAGFSGLFDGVGWIVSTAYWLLRDGLFQGQSVGKRLLELKVVGASGNRCTWGASALRNILWVIPLVNLVMGFTGLHYLFHDPAGRHWGDRLADTRVVKV